MNGYIEAGYTVTLVTLTGYGVSLRLRVQRALRRRSVPVVTAPDDERR